MKDWFEFYKESFKEALYIELFFGTKNIHLEDVPLTGKVDKLESLVGVSNEAKVVDYKTGKPRSRNDILGETQSSDGSLIRQLYFYKILCDLDPVWRMTPP